MRLQFTLRITEGIPFDMPVRPLTTNPHKVATKTTMQHELLATATLSSSSPFVEEKVGVLYVILAKSARPTILVRFLYEATVRGNERVQSR